jgi:SAM-dependent methyltransferase
VKYNGLRKEALLSDYDEWEEIYGRHPLEELPWERGKPREALVEVVEAGLVAPGKALDTCCGAGTNDIYLARKGFAVSAMDISPTAVGLAEETARRAGVEIDFRVGSFLDLPHASSVFDFVLDSGCFHHVQPQDREQYISEVRRVLGPGGKYLLICFSDRNGPAWNHFAEEDIGELFSGSFDILWARHMSTLEGDGVVRHFHNLLMKAAP